MIRETSSKYAPWHVVPADRKWFARFLASEILRESLEELNLSWPDLGADELEVLERCREILLDEADENKKE